ncbi:ATP-binding protein [Streptomyces sp. NPDC006195]|uniref:AAA family ATPase n=1 Tax=unclassified Streptomyces TaxID=2593676 RepID=UPI0033B87410
MPLPPLAVLLAGLTGSGKTTLARALSGRGFTRLSVDEEVHRLHGRYGIDYPEDTYFAREAPALTTIRDRFTAELGAGHDVVLDHGLWQRQDRNSWKEAARTAGGLPVLVHLPATREELLRHLTGRNLRADANALAVTPQALDDFLARYEAPGPDEYPVEYPGDADALSATLEQARRSGHPPA